MRKITIIITLASIFIILSMQSISSAELEDSQYLNYTIDVDSPNINIEDISTENHDFEIEKTDKLKTEDTNGPGTFHDLQKEIYNAEEGSTLDLTRDYNADNRIINITKDLTIDGHGHTINCLNNGESTVFSSYVGTITLKNMNIINSHNSGGKKGGAIFVTGTAKYTIENCTFDNSMATYEGGAIYSKSEYVLIIKNCRFTSNTANYGGAIFSRSSKVVVENSVFENNHADTDGGAIYCYSSIFVTNCTFENNRAEGTLSQCCGGAIHTSGDVVIDSCTFKDNYAADYGGAIYANNVRINTNQNNDADINTFFINNRANDNDGGAIYTEGSVEAFNTEFLSNSALVDGGAIYSSNNVVACHCLFVSNQASGASSKCYGGAIRAGENARINNCTFKNNYADNRGGAVYTSTVTLEGGPSRFEGNTVKDYGGAIYSDRFTNPVSQVSFINNQAGDGGAVYINKENWITFTDCIFMDNRASNRGGAIYLDSKNSHLTIRNNVFINNIAYNGGHTVFNYGYYDAISDNFWSILPTDYNNQLVEWKAVSSNIQHTDSNPVRFTMEIIGSCCANLTSGVKISFVQQDGTPATLPMISEYFSMSGVEGIEIEGKKVSSDSITILFTPTEVGTYELPAYILGMTGIMTINVIDGGAIIPEPLPEQDILRPDIPKPVIPPTKTTNC